MIVWIALLCPIKKKKNNLYFINYLLKLIYKINLFFNIFYENILLKTIQRNIRMIHFILFHYRVGGKHTMTDSDIQMASGL
jgi:hypothetical protein